MFAARDPSCSVNLAKRVDHRSSEQWPLNEKAPVDKSRAAFRDSHKPGFGPDQSSAVTLDPRNLGT